LVEQRVVAFALGHPGFGPARIAAELARPKWGGLVAWFGCGLLGSVAGMIRGHDHHRRPRPRAALASDPAAAGDATTPLRRPARIDDRACLVGIVYQLRTGVPWRLLPAGQLGCGSPVTCWRRLRDWQRAGVWQQLHHVLLDQLGRQGQLDWSRASLDSLSVRAKRGAA
jgi:transposase